MSRRCGVCGSRCARGLPSEGGGRAREGFSVEGWSYEGDGSGLGGHGQDFGEFEVDDAKAAEFVGVGDVSGFGVEVADAVVAFEVGEEFVGFFLGDLGCGFSAVGGDEVVFFGVFFEDFGDVGAATAFEFLEDGDLGGVSFGGAGSAEAFVDVSVEVDSDVGADAVFDGFDGHEDFGNGSP